MEEGKVKKGGVNNSPTKPRPEAPKGQGGSKEASKSWSDECYYRGMCSDQECNRGVLCLSFAFSGAGNYCNYTLGKIKKMFNEDDHKKTIIFKRGYQQEYNQDE